MVISKIRRLFEFTIGSSTLSSFSRFELFSESSDLDRFLLATTIYLSFKHVNVLPKIMETSKTIRTATPIPTPVLIVRELEESSLLISDSIESPLVI